MLLLQQQLLPLLLLLLLRCVFYLKPLHGALMQLYVSLFVSSSISKPEETVCEPPPPHISSPSHPVQLQLGIDRSRFANSTSLFPCVTFTYPGLETAQAAAAQVLWRRTHPWEPGDSPRGPRGCHPCNRESVWGPLWGPVGPPTRRESLRGPPHEGQRRSLSGAILQIGLFIIRSNN